MSTVLKPIIFNPDRFRQELDDLEALLNSKAELTETDDIQPFFKKCEHLTAYLGTFALNIAVATELCFEYEFFGDFKADVVLGSKQEKEFCVVEFEEGGQDSVFKKQPRRKNPEWSARFEHAFSQLTDWFYNLHDFKSTNGFANSFGTGHVNFTGLIVIGRSAGLDDAKRNRMRWRTDRVLIDTHKINCITFDDLHAALKNKFNLYSAASKKESTIAQPGLPPPQENS